MACGGGRCVCVCVYMCGGRDGMGWRETGSLFHSDGPAMVNACQPNVIY